MSRISARFLVAALALSLAACSPNLPGLPPISSFLPTAPVAVQASPLPSGSETPTLIPSATPTASPTETATSEPTFTPIPTLTSTDTPSVSATPTLPTATVGPTESPTLEVTATAISVSLDKLPPGLEYKRVRVVNRSHADMDISLHCTTTQGLQTVLEYEKVRAITISAPRGSYVYVVYVGGRQIVGTFSLLDVQSATITVYADHVTVQ